tara:strand:+ start:435 stop:659 length:225 start_codon:yes stop_codon:yes gene_type:complete
MAFVNINKKVRLILTEYGKEKLINSGDIGFKYFSFSDDGVRYDIINEPSIVIETQGNSDTTLYNGNKSPIIYKN